MKSNSVIRNRNKALFYASLQPCCSLSVYVYCTRLNISHFSIKYLIICQLNVYALVKIRNRCVITIRQTVETRIIFSCIISAQLLKNINVDHLHRVLLFYANSGIAIHYFSYIRTNAFLVFLFIRSEGFECTSECSLNGLSIYIKKSNTAKQLDSLSTVVIEEQNPHSEKKETN